MMRISLAWLCALCAPALAQHRMVMKNVTEAAGLTTPYAPALGMGAGASAVDFDGDGDIDIFVPNRDGVAHQMYVNQGDGTFVESAAALGLAGLEHSRQGLFIDYDGDHDLDLVVATDCFLANPGCVSANLFVYRQKADGTFEDVTASTGLKDKLFTKQDMHFGGMCAGDINNDGWVDLFVGEWSGKAGLFLNNGDGTFTDISVSSGVGVDLTWHWQPMMHDFNGDGFIDIYCATDFVENIFWINQGDNTFVDVAVAANAHNKMNDMGLALGDYDNDGDFDIYTTNIYLFLGEDRYNVLYRNDSTPTALKFTDVSKAAGVEKGEWGWGAAFADVDNDGLLDLMATNGFDRVENRHDLTRLFMNRGPGHGWEFQNAAKSFGFEDDRWGSGLACLDFDRDGDLDVLQSCQMDDGIHLMASERAPGTLYPPQNHLCIQPRMQGSNHFAVGAVVRVTVGGVTQSRMIHCGANFMSQEPYEAFFGVGTAGVIDEVRVEWPGGGTKVLTNVAANQLMTVNP